MKIGGSEDSQTTSFCVRQEISRCSKRERRQEEEEKEKHKLECEAKAEAKWVEKAKKEAWRGLKHKRGQWKQVKQVDTLSSEDSNAIEYNELSEYSSEAEESNYFNEATSDRCVECRN